MALLCVEVKFRGVIEGVEIFDDVSLITVLVVALGMRIVCQANRLVVVLSVMLF